MKTHSLLPAVCAIALAAPAFAASSTEFTFAPAPITQRLEAGENAKRLEFSYLTVDIPNNEWRGYGMNFTSRTASESGSGGFNFNANLLALSDEKNTTSGGLFGMAFGPELYLGSSRNTVLFGGLALSMMGMTMDVAGGESDISSVNYGLQAGLQYHFVWGPTEIIPYAMVNSQRTYTSVETSTSIGGWSSYSSTSSNTSSTTRTFGLDMLIGGLSLGALATSGGENDVRMFRLGFEF